MKFLDKCSKYIVFGICLITSFLLTHFFSYTNNNVINTSTVLDILITLFSVLLAIVALMITILDKYKEKVRSQNTWATKSTEVLKSLSENTILLLILIFVVISTSLLSDLLALLTKFNVRTFILLISIMLALFATLDTTISIHILVVHLKDAIATKQTIIELSQTEEHLVEAYRFLDPEYRDELKDYMNTLALKQQIHKKEKHSD